MKKNMSQILILVNEVKYVISPHFIISIISLFLSFILIKHINIAATINVTKYINKLNFQFPLEIFAPTIVEVITEGNLAKVEININLDGFIGKSPPIYTNKSFGVAGRKNRINKINSKV